MSIILNCRKTSHLHNKGEHNEKNQHCIICFNDSYSRLFKRKQVKLKVLVTQGDKKVENADDVQFQVEKEGYINQEMTKAPHEGKGVYSTDYTFKEDGEYMITAHVTVDGDMKMFTKKVEVGKSKE